MPLLISVPGMVYHVLVSCQAVLALLPLVSIGQGTASGIIDRREVVVQSEQQWQKLWNEHAPGAPPPPIDFTKELVAGVFVGQRPTAGYQVEIVRVERENGVLTIVYRIEDPPKDSMVAQVLSQPFHLVRLPGPALPVKFKKL